MARIAANECAQHLGLALWPIEHGRRLGLAPAALQRLCHLDLGHPLGTLGPAIDQRLDFAVNGVDVCPDLFEIPLFVMP